MHFTKLHKVAAGVATGGIIWYFARPLGTQKVPVMAAQLLSPHTALDPNAFKPFEVAHVENVSHDTKRYRFKLGTSDTVLGMTVASCLVTKINGPDDKPVIRPYTPVTLPNVKGYFDLVIKTYPEGVMSKHFATLKAGDKVEMKGPFSKIGITPNMKNAIGMVAGGTGITPMYQVITELLRYPENKTKITLLFGNKSAADILLKEQLDALAKAHPDTFTVHYVVDKPEPGWNGLTGYVNKDTIKEHLPVPEDQNIIFVCGPPTMMASVSGGKTSPTEQGPLTGALAELGYTPAQVFKF